MTDIQSQFRASFVRRWHTNTDLAQTVDTLAGHGGRVARIILKLWPDASTALLHWALVHDDGESVVVGLNCQGIPDSSNRRPLIMLSK